MRPIKRARADYPELKAFRAERREVLALLAKGAAVASAASVIGCVVDVDEGAEQRRDGSTPIAGKDASVRESDVYEPPSPGNMVEPDWGLTEDVGIDAYEPPLAGGEQEPDAEPPIAGDEPVYVDAEPPVPGGEQAPDVGVDAEPPLAGGDMPPPDAARVPQQGSLYYFAESDAAPDGFELAYFVTVESDSAALLASLAEDEAGWARRFNEALGALGAACTSDADLPAVEPINAAFAEALLAYALDLVGFRPFVRVQAYLERCSAQFLAGEAPGW